jgi:hypothetical protein
MDQAGGSLLDLLPPLGLTGRVAQEFLSMEMGAKGHKTSNSAFWARETRPEPAHSGSHSAPATALIREYY